MKTLQSTEETACPYMYVTSALCPVSHPKGKREDSLRIVACFVHAVVLTMHTATRQSCSARNLCSKWYRGYSWYIDAHDIDMHSTIRIVNTFVCDSTVQISLRTYYCIPVRKWVRCKINIHAYRNATKFVFIQHWCIRTTYIYILVLCIYINSSDLWNKLTLLIVDLSPENVSTLSLSRLLYNLTCTVYVHTKLSSGKIRFRLVKTKKKLQRKKPENRNNIKRM